MAKATKKPPTKTQIITQLSEKTGLAKKDVSAVLDELSSMIGKNLGRSGPGSFTIPGLVKMEKKKVPARPAKKNVPNPFKPGEFMDQAARPAHNKVTVRALKGLKDMV